MSLVVVQLGQCGNQLGRELFSTLASEAELHGDLAGCVGRPSTSASEDYVNAIREARVLDLLKKNCRHGDATLSRVPYATAWGSRSGANDGAS